MRSRSCWPVLPRSSPTSPPQPPRKALERLIREAQEFEDQGLYDAGSAARIKAGLRNALSIEAAVTGVDSIEEAVFKNPEVKREVLARISAAARPDAIISTNTSTIPVKVLVDAVQRPERFLTVHFSNPAPFIPVVELVAGGKTDPKVIPVVRELLAKTGRQGAQVADVPSFVLNRLQYVLSRKPRRSSKKAWPVSKTSTCWCVLPSVSGCHSLDRSPSADQAGLDVYAGLRRLFLDF